MNTSIQSFSRLNRSIRLTAILFCLVIAVAPLHAADKKLHYLASGQPDAATLLAPPPLPDSPEQAADMETVVVECIVPVEMPEEGAAEAVPGEPEVIGAKEEEEESEEKKEKKEKK